MSSKDNVYCLDLDDRVSSKIDDPRCPNVDDRVLSKMDDACHPIWTTVVIQRSSYGR